MDELSAWAHGSVGRPGAGCASRRRGASARSPKYPGEHRIHADVSASRSRARRAVPPRLRAERRGARRPDLGRHGGIERERRLGSAPPAPHGPPPPCRPAHDADPGSAGGLNHLGSTATYSRRVVDRPAVSDWRRPSGRPGRARPAFSLGDVILPVPILRTGLDLTAQLAPD